MCFSLLLLTLLSSCFFPDVFPEESNGEGGGGAETETSAIRAEPPGQPEQRAGPPQKNGGGVLLVEYNCYCYWSTIKLSKRSTKYH